MSGEERLNLILGIVVLALVWAFLHFAPSSRAIPAVESVPVPAAIEIQQRHPDWPIHYCQRIANGIVSTGMTRDMVVEAWGSPTQQLQQGNSVYLSYDVSIPIADFTSRCCGVRNVVELQRNVVNSLLRMNIFGDNLDSWVGQPENMILFFFGPPAETLESSAGNVWTYEATPFCRLNDIAAGITADTVGLYFDRDGNLRSWIRH